MDFIFSDHDKLNQGAPWSWKVMEFRKTIFQAWKVMEFDENVMAFLLLHCAILTK